MTLRKGLLGTYAAQAAQISLESDLEEAGVAADTTPEVLVEIAEANVVNVIGDEETREQEIQAVEEEEVALESCLSGLRTLINMENAAVALTEAGHTPEEATEVVAEEVIATLEEIDASMVEGADAPALEADVAGSAKAFWDKVKAMAKKIKDAIVGLLKSLKTRAGQIWDNLTQSTDRVRKTAVALKKAVADTKDWNASAKMKARANWVVAGEVSATAIADAVKRAITNDRSLREAASKNLGGEAVRAATTSLQYVGFIVTEANTLSPTKLESESEVDVGSKDVNSRIASDVYAFAAYANGEASKAVKADLDKINAEMEKAIKAAEDVVKAAETEEAKAEAKTGLENIKAAYKQAKAGESYFNWLTKGAPLRSCNNALSFVAAAIKAAGKKEAEKAAS